MKFKVGDKVRQIKQGYGTDSRDNGKEAFVIEVGLNYIINNGGITINTIGEWEWDQTIRGEDGFELVIRLTQTENLRRLGYEI